MLRDVGLGMPSVCATGQPKSAVRRAGREYAAVYEIALNDINAKLLAGLLISKRRTSEAQDKPTHH